MKKEASPFEVFAYCEFRKLSLLQVERANSKFIEGIKDKYRKKVYNRRDSFIVQPSLNVAKIA